MTQIISDKGTQGITVILESGDETVQCWHQAENNTVNADDVNGVTISPVPAAKKLIITNLCLVMQDVASNVDLEFSNSAVSATNGDTLCQVIQGGEQYINIPVYWEIATTRYLVITEGGGGKCQVFMRGILADV